MTASLDRLLNRLKSAPPDHNLSGLESAVLSRINRERRADIFGASAFQVQLAVSCGALLLGLAIAQFAGFGLMPRTLSSELVVLSDDSSMAPSVRLEGGI